MTLLFLQHARYPDLSSSYRQLLPRFPQWIYAAFVPYTVEKDCSGFSPDSLLTAPQKGAEHVVLFHCFISIVSIHRTHLHNSFQSMC